MSEYEFVVSDGSGRTQTRVFPSARFVVGAAPDCPMRIEGAGLMASHAEVLFDHRGQPWVRDLTGQGLVWVNGEPTKQAMIPPGTFVRLGSLELVVRHRTAVKPAETRMAASGQRREAQVGTDATLRRPTPFVSQPSPEPMALAEVAPAPPDDTTLRGSLLQPGTIIDERYQVVAKLAAGGMGEVYRADHVELGKPMAIKVMLPELSRDPEFVARFKREAIAASRIGQQNIVDISDFGRTRDGRFYFVMEYLDGLTLASAVHRGGAMALGRVVSVIAQVGRALSAAHALGIVHRDLKPENIMLLQRPGQADFVKVLDFGVAKVAAGHGQGGHTAIGMVVGTPQYMSPEQAKAIPVDARSDIYSLGLITYELITGRPTFSGETPSILMVKHVTEAPPPLTPGPLEDVPGELEELVFQMLEKDPAARPQTMEEVVKRLDWLDAKLKTGAPLRPRAAALATPATSGVAVRVTGGQRSVVSSGTRNSSVRSSSQSEEHEPVAEGHEPGLEEDLRRPVAPLVGGLVVLVLIAAGAVAYLLRDSKTTAEVAPVAVAHQETPSQKETLTPPPPPPVDVKAPATQVVMHVKATPEGVEVYEKDAWIGTAPLDIARAVDSELELKFVLKGYKSQTKKIRFVSDQVLPVVLEREREREREVVPRHRPAVKPELSGNPYEESGGDLKPLPE